MMDTFYTRRIGRNLTGPRTIDVNKAVQYIALASSMKRANRSHWRPGRRTISIIDILYT